MQLKEIVTPNIEGLKPRDPVAHAVKRMRDLNVGAMPIFGTDGRWLGIVTDRDIAASGTDSDSTPLSATVSEVMTTEVAFCFEDRDVAEVAHAMEQQQIYNLAILNHDKRLVGIVSRDELVLRLGTIELS